MLGNRLARRCALVVTLAMVAAMLVTLSGTAGALKPPWTPATVTAHQTPHVICRAYGGSLSANTEADQDLGFTVTYPDGVHPGDTFNIKIRPDVSLYPRTDTSTGTTATIVYIYNQMSGYQLPAGLTINSVSQGPSNGNVEANPDAGYYVLPANVPHSVVSGQGDVPTEGFDPMTLPAAQRLAIPGTAPNAFWNTSTNRVYTTLLGSTSSSLYAGGSALQGPSTTINVTATGSIGTHLQVKLAGQLPGSEPRNYTGSQPNNFGAPSSGASLTSQAAASPWFSTNGTRYVYGSDTVWTDPTYLNTVHTTALGGLITIDAKAACAPGYEATSAFPTPPSYYTGTGAIPNGTSPPLTDTYIAQTVDSTPSVITVTAPIDGAHYVSESGVIADYDCNDTFGSGDDVCTGDVPDGSPIDMSVGTHTFTVNAVDLAGNPSSQVVTYSVAGNQAPTANHGPDQTGKKTGDTVTLDGSASSDPDGPPAQPLTYTWTQTGGVPVTLSNSHAVKPTFTIPPNPAFVYPHAITFSLNVDDGVGGSNTTADSVSIGVVATTPTLSAVGRSPSGTVFTGDTVTLTSTVSNPDGGALTYAWSQVSGRTTSLSSNSAVAPTFNVPSSGAAPTTSQCTSGTTTPVSPTNANCPRFQLQVTATGTGAGSSATVALAAYGSSLPSRPVANAGAAQNAAGLATVTLNGSGTQTQNHALSYAWSQTSGPAVTLSSTTVAKPTFTAPAATTGSVSLGFSLTVVDTQSPITGTGTNGNTSTASTTTVTVVPDHVIANPGPNQTGKVAGNLITLDGSGSTDPNLAPLSYTWTQVSNGAPTVTLSNPNLVNPTFTAPAATTAGGYTAQFNLTATNGGPNPGDTGTSATPVSITVAASTPTVAVAKARSGGTCANFCTGDLITLSANITNPDGNAEADYTYVWTQTGGRTTALSSTTAAHPTYFLPLNGSTGNSACTSGTGAVSATSANCPTYSVVVTKTNTTKASTNTALAAYASTLATRPVANAGTAQTVKVGSGTVTLDGSASAQANGHPFTYAWSQTAGPAVTLSSTTAQKPTFTAPNAPASYTFSLTVTDSQNPLTGTGTNGQTSTASTVTITVSNYTAPVANPGTNQSVVVGTPTHLDASGSSQADGHTLSYSWSQTAGPAVTLDDTTAVKPSFTAPNAGTTLKFKVTVTDTQNPNPAAASTTSADVTITVTDYASPIASPGSNQNVKVATPVALDASGSSQADGHLLTYSWTQTAGTLVALSDATAAQPTFTAPNAGTTLKFTVTVTDAQNPNPAAASTTSAEVTITVSDYASPIASQGSNQSVLVAAPVTLDASGSSQADGHLLTYSWAQTAGTAVTLSSTSAQQPTFTAPSAGTTLKFRVTVTDAQNPNPATASTTSAEVSIAVGDFASPLASQGTDQTVHRRDVVTLDASGSSQADGHTLHYLWAQTAGTAVTLSDATAQKPTFTAPEAPGSLKFTVTVTDTQNPNPSTASTTSGPVQIDVQDYAAPIADAGSNQSNIDIGTTVTLDGSASSQADLHPLTYSWTQTGGPAVTLSDSHAAKPTFTAPTGPLTLTFQLTVDDTYNTSAPATVFVNVNGIAGLDFAAQITGDVRGEKASSVFQTTVSNNGVLSRSIASSGLAVSITRNNVAVPASEYSIAAKTVTLAAHKQATFVLTWNHGTTALHLGDNINVSVCVNQLGDSVPANNCGVKVDPQGPLSVFAWPKTGWAVKSTQTSTNVAVWITNMSSFTARPIRVSENMTVTVKVNNGPEQTLTAPTTAPFSLASNLGTNDVVYPWAHPKLTKGDSVEVKACAVNVPGNTAVPNCWTRTITVT